MKKERRAITRTLAKKRENRRLTRKALMSSPPVRRILGKISAALKRQSPSTVDGQSAKKLILKSMKSWRTALTLNGKALRAVLAGKRNKALRIFDRQQAAYDRSDSYARQAVGLLQSAGVDTTQKRAVR